MAGISTHVLDTDRGRPAAGVKIELSVREGETWRMVKTMTTDADGRTDGPVVTAADARVGEYQLEFHTDAYFKGLPDAGAGEPFVDNAVVRFSIFDVKQHYHVPLLCTPGSCTTYRGS